MEEAGGWGAALRRRRAALLMAAAIPVLVLVGLPFSDSRWAPVEGFVSMWAVFILACDLLTATLLIVLHRQGEGSRLLVLACAYLWSGSTMVMVMVAVPGVIQQDPTFASEAPGWLWTVRHLGPPVIIGIALAPWLSSVRAQLSGIQPSWRRSLAVAGGVVLLGPGTILVLLLTIPSRLPSLVDAETGDYAPWLILLVVATNLVVVVVATLGVVLRAGRSGIEVWALVAAVAWLGDVAFTFMFEEQFTLAWYAARLLGMAASAVVLGVILGEVVVVRRRLLAGNRDMEAQINDLLEAQQLRDHVSAVVSHDMRAPIAGLQGYLEILDDDDVDPAFVRRIHERCLILVKRLSLLTEDLQAAAIAAHGDLEVLPELLDVESQLVECANGFPGLDLRIECEPDLVVWADPLRLQQTLSNLIRNAEKHGAEPVLVNAGSEPGGMVVFRVSDAGQGVPESFIPRLFERYSQGPDHAPGGSGLGLSVARDLVRAHHGTVRYDLTTPAFIVTLPAGPTEIRTPMGRVISPPRRMGNKQREYDTQHTHDAV